MHTKHKKRLVFLTVVGVLATLVIFFLLWSPPDTTPTYKPKEAEKPSEENQKPTSILVVEEETKEDPDRFEKELGHRVWSYLHTLASNYPVEEGETEEDKLKLFGKLYPCSTCGRHFREMIKEHPPPLKGTRVDFEMWLCERHNQVNKRYEQTDGCPLE